MWAGDCWGKVGGGPRGAEGPESSNMWCWETSDSSGSAEIRNQLIAPTQ